MSNSEQNQRQLDAPALELAARQASLAFERTFSSLDQALMSAIRTSLSLIGFGFAMILFFYQFGTEVGVNLRVPARNFGLSLVAIGVGLVTIALVGHQRGSRKIRMQMDDLHQRHLLLEGGQAPRAPIALIALLLLLSGLLVILGIVVRIGPFG
jgi:putative membrane protein